MSEIPEKNLAPDEFLFGRVATILEHARSNVIRAVNSNMVIAYWLIGSEIVQALQGGEDRAEYGKQVLQQLSQKLVAHYGKGFSVTTLRYFRAFYLAYADRSIEIQHPVGAEFETPAQSTLKQRPLGAESSNAFNPQLSWSHYRVLMRVKNLDARSFYEREAIEGGWDKRTLERQTSTQYYERCLNSQQPNQLIAEGRQLQKTASSASDILKNPYVLEFLGYPNFAELRESDIERAIIAHLQRFLLELGNGFAFVARQKHIRIEEDDRFIDLVFYHCRQKFYLLIDLKLGKLTHGDVGQMDGYVRMFDGLFTAPDDNPTIGLILCTEKCDTVARYSVLNDRKQLFAAKYMLSLPTEEQLQIEIARERRLIEAAMAEREEDNNE
jgi:predicted nuclease of restriction endonuclease-like (RecB) superfamily